MDILSIVKEQYISLQSQKKWIESELKKSPAGRIRIQKRGNTYRWYLYMNQKSQYIPRKNKQEAEDLAYKLYLQTVLEDTDRKLLALESFQKWYDSRSDRAENLLEKAPAIRELIYPRLLALPNDLERWAKEEYDKSAEYSEFLKYPTVRGELVRSKSESQISYVLAKNNIPYRYECALPLNGIKFYPDFTTMRPFDRKIIIWEHFGLLDKPSYIDNATSKLNIYIKNGWIPGKNLIITTETEQFPLDIRQVEELVKFHYLPGIAG